MATTGVPSGVELTALLKDLSDKQELSDSLQKALANHHDVIAQLGNCYGLILPDGEAHCSFCLSVCISHNVLASQCGYTSLPCTPVRLCVDALSLVPVTYRLAVVGGGNGVTWHPVGASIGHVVGR